MTKELKALIEDLRLNHEFCPKEIILQAANELERLSKPEQEPFEDLAPELFVVAQTSPADDGFSDTIDRIEKWLREHFSTTPQHTWVGSGDLEDSNAYLTPPQRKPLTDEQPAPQSEQEQEPVAIEYWLQDTMESGRWVTTGNMSRAAADDYCEVYPQGRIVEPSPPKRTWVDLSDEEIQAIAKQARSKDHAVTLTNKFLREKNT